MLQKSPFQMLPRTLLGQKMLEQKQPTLCLVGMKLLSMIIDRTQLLQDGHQNTTRAKN